MVVQILPRSIGKALLPSQRAFLVCLMHYKCNCSLCTLCRTHFCNKVVNIRGAVVPTHYSCTPRLASRSRGRFAPPRTSILRRRRLDVEDSANSLRTLMKVLSSEGCKCVCVCAFRRVSPAEGGLNYAVNSRTLKSMRGG